MNPWKTIKLEEITEKVGSGATPRGGFSSYKLSGIPLIRSMNVHFDGLRSEGLVYLDDKQADGLKNVEVKAGDVLLNITGASIGRVTQAPKLMDGARVNQHVCIIRPTPVLDAKFLCQYLSSPSIQAMIMDEEYGGTRQALTKQMILNFDIPLPPLNEQRRIVAKIEALKARSQRVKEELEAIAPLLDQFRQSVLAAAFRGDLTADWREKNPHFTREWHNNLLTAVRSPVTQTKRQGQLWGSGTSLQEVDESWAKLPDTWNWVKVIDLGYDPDVVVQIGPMSMKSEEFTETGTTVLNVGCVQWNGLNLQKCNYLPPARAADFERYRVCKGDVLFTRSGAVGRSAIVTPEVDGALITFHLLRVRTSSEICIPEYLYFAFRGCSAVRSQIDDSAIGATRAGFNTKLLQNIWLPLPPPEEQAQILQEIKKRFKFADSIMGQISEGASFLDKLNQSILAKAFRGELVPQNPNDEPASVLLERIKAEREKLDTKKKVKDKTEKKSRKAKPKPEPKQLSFPGFE